MLLGTFQSLMTPIVTLVFFAILAAFVFGMHLLMLPLYSHTLNVLKGVIYASVCWVSMSSIVLAALDDSEGSNRSNASQALFALVPVVAALGGLAVHQRKCSILTQIKKIRTHLEVTDPVIRTHSGNRRKKSLVDDFFDEDPLKFVECFPDYIENINFI